MGQHIIAITHDLTMLILIEGLPVLHQIDGRKGLTRQMTMIPWDRLSRILRRGVSVVTHMNKLPRLDLKLCLRGSLCNNFRVILYSKDSRFY